MKIAVIGIHGNIGSVFVQRGAIPLDVDVTKDDDVRRAIKKASPDIIIHTASKSKPDWCENHKNEAVDVNYLGSIHVARWARKFNISVVALSTDHVFSGSNTLTKLGPVSKGPYSEDYNRLWPINYYGLTKATMEAAMDVFDNVKIVRTSNCFWKDDPRAMWYINQVYKEKKVPVPTFQYRSFMHRQHFVESLEKYCENFDKMPKILHISGSETVNWYDFMKAFAEAIGTAKYFIDKFTKKRFETDNFPANRPKKAGLKIDLSKKLGLPQYSYLDGMELLK